MLRKKERTLDMYFKLGAEMRLLKWLTMQALSDSSKVLSIPDSDRLYPVIKTLEALSSRAEDNMFRDFPELPNSYIHVFYGSLDGEPIDEVDGVMMEKTRELINDRPGARH